MDRPAYRRVLLKLSGEALMGKRSFGIDPEVVDAIAAEIRDVVALGVQLGIVIGGGNIFRGVDGEREGDGPNHRRLHGDAGHGDQQPCPPERPGTTWVSPRGCRRPSKCKRSPNRSSRGGPSATWRRDGW